MRMLKSRAGDVMSEDAWRAWIDEFWEYAEKQNKGRNTGTFTKPSDYFERIERVLGLESIGSWDGVF